MNTKNIITIVVIAALVIIAVKLIDNSRNHTNSNVGENIESSMNNAADNVQEGLNDASRKIEDATD